MSQFEQLGLRPEILKALTDKGYHTPSPIQASAIPAILKGRDMLASAQTGTGKTAGFVLPIIEQLSSSSGKAPRALIITPTRELAAQILDNINAYNAHLSLRATVVFGGVKIGPQIKTLNQGVDILVATPGRLVDLMEQGACNLNGVEMLVLDEADRMLDMGFIRDIRKIIKRVPKKRQTLLFSATFTKEIRAIANDFLHNSVTVEVASQNATADRIVQKAYRCDSGVKTQAVISLIKEEDLPQVIVFTRTKHGANRLSKNLEAAGIKSAAIHGNKSQGARTRALSGFKEKKLQVLVATDIAARGIDISDLPFVINFELPNVPEDYVHRIGRTGRAGKDGLAISLVCNEERPFHSGIEKLTGNKIPLEDLEKFPVQDWPQKAPTAKDVMRLKEQRKQEARKQRSQPSKKKSQSSSRPNSRNRNRRRN